MDYASLVSIQNLNQHRGFWISNVRDPKLILKQGNLHWSHEFRKFIEIMLLDATRPFGTNILVALEKVNNDRQDRFERAAGVWAEHSTR